MQILVWGRNANSQTFFLFDLTNVRVIAQVGVPTPHKSYWIIVVVWINELLTRDMRITIILPLLFCPSQVSDHDISLHSWQC